MNTKETDSMNSRTANAGVHGTTQKPKPLPVKFTGNSSTRNCG